MSWNDSIQRKKFKAQQVKQADEYRKIGMTDEQITAMYEFDLAQYRSDRRYYSHTQPFIESSFDDDCNGDEGKSPMLDKLIEKLSVKEDYSHENSRYWWIEDIDDSSLAKKLKSLSVDDIELLTLFAFDGYTQSEIASLYGISQKNICKKLTRIKNFLSEGV